MSGEHQKRYNQGDPLLAKDLNHRSESIERIENLSAVSPMAVTQTASGLHLTRRTRRNILARLSGGSSPYSWVKIQEQGDGNLVEFPSIAGTSNAYEVNNVSGLENQIVEMVPDPFGDWRFQWIGYGNRLPDPPNKCLCWNPDAIPSSLTYTISSQCFDGVNWNETTSSSGTLSYYDPVEGPTCANGPQYSVGGFMGALSFYAIIETGTPGTCSVFSFNDECYGSSFSPPYPCHYIVLVCDGEALGFLTKDLSDVCSAQTLFITGATVTNTLECDPFLFTHIEAVPGFVSPIRYVLTITE